MVRIKSITTNILLVTFVAITLVGSAVMSIAIIEHEALYRQQVLKDISAVSSNLSDDLVPLMAQGNDYFLLSTSLLRLNKYENVLYAKVLSNNWQEVQVYYGQQSHQEAIKQQELPTSQIQQLGLGSHFVDHAVLTVHLIGDRQLPLGYLAVYTDYTGPISESKSTLIYKVLPSAIVLVLFSLAFILYRQHKLLSPLSTINEFTKEVKRTSNYGLRLQQLGKYEVEELSLNINDMMNTIEGEVKKNQASRERLEEQQTEMEQMANYDSLTGLPNRSCFIEMLKVSLANAKRGNFQAAIMFIDLDGFKDVNDNYGHHIGDLLLVEVSHRMKECLRESDVLCRLGGDEFLVLIPYFADEFTLVRIANRLIEYLQQPFLLKEWEIFVGASIGITTAADSDFDVSSIIGNADIAMYQSKVDGKGTYTVFVPQMMENSKRRFEIANSINLSLMQNDFHLVYQAKVNEHQQIIGYETLLRWVHQDLGFVSPAEFIPIAEKSGKMASITKWVLKRLCIELPQVLALNERDVLVSVNLSANDLKQPDLLSYIKMLFKRYEVDPRNVEFEVTESAYLEDLQGANKFFNEIKGMGCSLALDDFGTGYSSLSYLTQIPIDTLKLDKQFVDTIGKSERATLITKTIMAMAKNLDIKVCAEGVENFEQFYFLINCQCDQVQGYLFSKPLPLEKMAPEQTVKKGAI